MREIDERGSLCLFHDPGDDQNPEQFWVQFRDQPHISGSLTVAREFFEVGGVRLNGSQAVTVKAWYEEYL